MFPNASLTIWKDLDLQKRWKAKLTASWRSHSASSPSPPQTLWCSSLQSPYRIPQTPHPPPVKTKQGMTMFLIKNRHWWTNFKVDLHLTRFMRSRRSVISLSRDWMILLMSLMRGPKFASSLSSLDFSCMTKIKQSLHNGTSFWHVASRQQE